MRTRIGLSAAVLTCSLVLPAGAESPSGGERDAYLQAVEENYSSQQQMLGMPFTSPGYHSQVPAGTWVHPTRQSLDYAASLLDRHAEGDAARAAQVIRRVLSLQDTDPQSRTYGIWPWLLEEPLEQMAPPDWNWADFCGARLALMLHDHAERLPEDLLVAMRQSLNHAAQAIRRRDVQPSYTNIAIMGGGVCAAAGELTGDQQLLSYGRERLQRVVEHAAFHGGFNEYNSPTYTMVALWECERTLHLVADPQTRAAAEALRRIAWETIAGSFHPATAQWAGPHSRAYSDRLSRSTAAYLAEQTEARVPVHPSMEEDATPRAVDLFPHLPCPDELRGRFQALPEDPFELQRTFVRNGSGEPTAVGTTWFGGEACLGSINRSTLWTQRRALLGYWRSAIDPAVVFRLRFLHDGRDFASLAAAIEQSGPRAVLALYPLRNHGAWHVSLDRPADGLFQAEDLRLRLELSGRGVQVRALDQAALQFELAAEPWRVVVHGLPGRFAGQEVRWTTAVQEGAAAVEAICYQGERKAFDFRRLPEVVLAAGIELIGSQAAITEISPMFDSDDPAVVRIRWPLEPPLVTQPD